MSGHVIPSTKGETTSIYSESKLACRWKDLADIFLQTGSNREKFRRNELRAFAHRLPPLRLDRFPGIPESQSRTSWQSPPRRIYPLVSPTLRLCPKAAVDVPSSDEVPSLEMLHQRLRSRQADESGRHERAAQARFGGAVLDVP
jgi:hypothetical protein